MRPFALSLVIGLLCVGQGIAGEDTRAATSPPALLELPDQYDVPQRFIFPTTNVVVLTIADRKGSEQVDSWVAALKARYAGRIELRGLADVRGVPDRLRAKVRKRFQETRGYPVMLDWSGTNCARFGAKPGVANVLVLARDGLILSSQRGPATDAELRTAFIAIDAALKNPSTPSTIGPASSTTLAKP